MLKREEELYEALIHGALNQYIILKVKECNLNYEKIAEMKAVKILNEVKLVIQNTTLNDFDAMEQIVCIFEKYHLNAQDRHDF